MVKGDSGSAILAIMFAATLLGILLIQALDVPRRVERQSFERWKSYQLQTMALSKSARATDAQDLGQTSAITPSLLRFSGEEQSRFGTRKASLYYYKQNVGLDMPKPSWRELGTALPLTDCDQVQQLVRNQGILSARTCENIASIQQGKIFQGNINATEDLVLAPEDGEMTLVATGRIAVRGRMLLSTSSENSHVEVIALGDILVKEIALQGRAAVEVLLYSEVGKIELELAPIIDCASSDGLKVRIESRNGIKVGGVTKSRAGEDKGWGCTVSRSKRIWPEKKLIGMEVE